MSKPSGKRDPEKMAEAYRSYEDVVRRLCLKGLSLKEILAHSEMADIIPHMGFSEHNWQEVYQRFVYIWAFQGKYNIDYFIEKFEAIPENLWCTNGTEDALGRKDVFGHCGLKKAYSRLNEEAMALAQMTKNHYLDMFYVNDGILAQEFGQTPKERVVNVLKDLRNKWLNLREVSADFPETEPIYNC